MHHMISSIQLASTSPRRLHLLESLGFKVFTTSPNVIEDQLENEHVYEMVMRLAKLKANAIEDDSDLPIIAADTVVSIHDEVLGKPKDELEAISMLTLLSGKEHTVISGYVVRFKGNEKTGYVSTQVGFRHLSPVEIKAYVETKEPFDKAGAYGIQGLGACLVDWVNGSYTNVLGLPLTEVLKALKTLCY